MRRREFIAGLSAAAWPRAALAQLPQLVIGFLGSDREELRSNRFRAFHEALTEAGYTDGRNITIEFRWGDGEVSRFPELASDLVRRQVAVIASLAGIPSAKAAKEATSTIPIVFQGGFDPVELGLVASLSELAMRHRIPAISESPEFVRSGGLLSYSGNREDAFRLAGRYVGRILKGEKPADLPVQQATRVEMAVSLKVAKALNIDVPLSLLGGADEVIE
jgi:ABC-type uncharacterized transport system substrate-binding protein